jgi:hypothetical protein
MKIGIDVIAMVGFLIFLRRTGWMNCLVGLVKCRFFCFKDGDRALGESDKSSFLGIDEMGKL